MKNYLRNWTIMRFLRLLIGVIIIIQGAYENQWMIVGLGALFTLLPLFNVSACGMGSCGVSPRRRAGSKLDEVTYKEIK